MANEYNYQLSNEQEQFYNGEWQGDDLLAMVLDQSDINSLRRCFITGNTVAGRLIIKMVNDSENYQLIITVDDEESILTMNNGTVVVNSLYSHRNFNGNILQNMNNIFQIINGNDPMKVIDSISILKNKNRIIKYTKPENCSWNLAKQRVLPLARQNISAKKTMKKYLLPRLLQRRNKKALESELKMLPPMGIFPGGIDFQNLNEKYSNDKYFNFGNCNNCNSWINKSIKYLQSL